MNESIENLFIHSSKSAMKKVFWDANTTLTMPLKVFILFLKMKSAQQVWTYLLTISEKLFIHYLFNYICFNGVFTPLHTFINSLKKPVSAFEKILSERLHYSWQRPYRFGCVWNTKGPFIHSGISTGTTTLESEISHPNQIITDRIQSDLF